MASLDELISGTQESLEIEFKGGRKGLFSNPRNIPFRVGDHAVVDIDRGRDIGVVIRDGDEVSAKTEEKGIQGPILRRATSADLELLAELREKEAEAHKICQQCIARQDLPMKLVDVEWQFDGNKIRFYFTSDHRVDFRKLVRDLAATFKTRIEMRQIGVRDEARRLGGYGRCGRYYCCRGVIQDFDPVTLKMVKEQHLAPGSPKISGGCGRLMCCLRYERGFYADASREYPKVGSKITLKGGGRGRVLAVDIFHRKVTVGDEEGKSVTVSVEDYRSGGFSIGDSNPPADGQPTPMLERLQQAERAREAASRTRPEATEAAMETRADAGKRGGAPESASSERSEAETARPGGGERAEARAEKAAERPSGEQSGTGGKQASDGARSGDAGSGGGERRQGKSGSKRRRGRRSGGSRRRGSKRGRSGKSRKGSNSNAK